MRIRFSTALIILSGALVSTVAVTATAATQAKEDPKSILDRIYSVPQSERGDERFKTSCSSCHTPGSFSGGAFADRWSGQTMGEVYEFVSNNMPENDPGGLKPDQYADVLAYILRVNGYPVGADDMPANRDALKKYEVVPNPK